MNNYIVRSYRTVIVITRFAITKYAIRRASKAQSIVIIKTKNILKNINKNNRLSMGKFSKVPLLLTMHTQHHRGPWTVDQA